MFILLLLNKRTSKNRENGIRIAFSCPPYFFGARPHDAPKTSPDDLKTAPRCPQVASKALGQSKGDFDM